MTASNTRASLNEEIQQVLATYSVPDEVNSAISQSMAELDENRVAPGLEVGERAPHFKLPDLRGNIVSLAETLQSGPAVVTFFRGAWCPICNLQMMAFDRAMPEVRAAGARLLAIHPDSAAAFGEMPEYAFDVLTDADQAVIRDYRLQYLMPPKLQPLYINIFQNDISQKNANGTWRLPVPGTFVIDREGKIRSRHVTADFTRRMEPEDVVKALRGL